MASPYPQQGYQQAQGGQPVVIQAIQVVQQPKSSSDGCSKMCSCLAGTGCAICIGLVAIVLVLIGSIYLIVGTEHLETTAIVLLAIGGILLIGSCCACAHFRKGLDSPGQVFNQPQAAVAAQPLISPVVPQPPAGAVYPGPQFQPPPGAVYPGPQFQPPPGAVYPGPQHQPPPGAVYPGPQFQPPPGAVYPGPQHQPPPGAVYPGPQQHQQYPTPPPGYSVPGPMQQPGYGPGYIPGQMGGTIPEQPAPPYSSKAGEAAAASAPMPPSDQTSEYERPPAYAP